MITGTHMSIDADDSLDADGQLAIITDISTDWLDKDMAINLMAHLTKVFKLSELQAAIEKYKEVKK